MSVKQKTETEVEKENLIHKRSVPYRNQRWVDYFFLLVSHLRLSQRVDDTAVGWLNHFIVIALYQQQPSGPNQP